MYNVKESIEAQHKLQQEKGLPNFAPSSGICYKCKRNIYEPFIQTFGENKSVSGIETKRASNELITGCPHCHHSYCE